jgi:hypothetical protein
MAEVPGLLQLAKELRLQVRRLPGWLGSEMQLAPAYRAVATLLP